MERKSENHLAQLITNHTKNLKAFLKTKVFLKLKNANENETEILNSNKSCKTEQSTFQNDNAKAAFTLAEVLITLGIIGIVAAMTMPTLIQNYQEKATVAKVQKAYSILSQAYLMAVQEHGTIDEWGTTTMNDASSHAIVANKFIPYLKVTKNCVGMSSSDIKKYCSKVYTNPSTHATVKIADGTTVTFRVTNNLCSINLGVSKQLSHICGNINIDINGDALPNTIGKDGFTFRLSKYGIIPAGIQGDAVGMEKYCNITKGWEQSYDGYTNGSACAAWVIYNGNMDYLKCELNWDSGKKSCNE